MFKILKKELLTFVKDRRALMLTFLLPVILISVFSLAFNGLDNNRIQTIPLLLCDQDSTIITKQMIGDIDSIKMLKVIPTTYDSGINLVVRGEETAILVFRKGFSDSMSAMRSVPFELHYDASQIEEMKILQSILEGALYRSISNIMRENNNEKNTGEQFKETNGHIKNSFPISDSKNIVMGNSGAISDIKNNVKLNLISVGIIKAGNLGLVQAFAGTSVMMLLFSLTGIGGSLLDEKEQGTLKRLLYSPIHPAEILAGKMACAMTIAVFQLIAMITFSSLVFHLELLDRIIPLAIILLATAFACTGFGVFLSTIAKSRPQLQSLSTIIVLSMSVIGGSMVPTYIMPQWMQKIGVLSINYWSIQGFYDVLYRQLPIAGIFLEKVAILLLFGTFLTVLAFHFFTRNLLAAD